MDTQYCVPGLVFEIQTNFQCCLVLLLCVVQANFQGDWNRRRFAVDDEHRRANALPTPTVLTLDAEPRNRRRRVVLYNSLASQRVQLVTVRYLSIPRAKNRKPRPLFGFSFIFCFFFRCAWTRPTSA